jgi:transposase
MLSISPVVKIFVYGQPADLRRGYDGLAAIVQHAMQEDPLSGSLFVFVNKRGNRIKLLYWDDTGYAIWMKRLEMGSFELPKTGDASSVRIKITPSQLALILDGIELSSVVRRKRYQRPCPARTA